MTIIWSKVPYWEVSMTWNKRNTAWLRIQWGTLVIKYWDIFNELPHNTGKKCKGEIIPFLLWMAHTPCSPTELVNLHSYSFGAHDATQNLQCRLCTKGFERTILWVKRTPFSATKNNPAPSKCETQVGSHPVNEQFHTDHLEQRQQDDTGQVRAWRNTRQRVHGITFWWLILWCKTSAGVHEKEKENKQDSLKGYSKCSQNQGHLIYSILQPADILEKCPIYWNQ